MGERSPPTDTDEPQVKEQKYRNISEETRFLDAKMCDLKTHASL